MTVELVLTSFVLSFTIFALLYNRVVAEEIRLKVKILDQRLTDEPNPFDPLFPAPQEPQGEAPSLYGEGKPRAALFPAHQLWEMLLAFENGAEKYAPHDWQVCGLPEGYEDRSTYFADKALRHIMADRMGETRDPETGLKHLTHAAVDLVMADWHRNG